MILEINLGLLYDLTISFRLASVENNINYYNVIFNGLHVRMLEKENYLRICELINCFL